MSWNIASLGKVETKDGRTMPAIPNTPPVTLSHDLMAASKASMLAKVKTVKLSDDNFKYANTNIRLAKSVVAIAIITDMESDMPEFCNIAIT